MKNLIRKLLAGLYVAQLALTPINAQDVINEGIPVLQDIRSEGDNIIIEMSQSTPYKISNLPSQSKLIIEIQESQYKVSFSKKDLNSKFVRRVRGYQFKETPMVSRVVLDLKTTVDYNAFNVGSNLVVSLRANQVLEQQVQQLKNQKIEEVKAPVKPQKKRDLLDTLPREVVTLDFEGADIRDVVRLMSETSGINIIFGPEVNGNISIHLKKVPFSEAFKTIMNLKGLVATQLGSNILRVTTPDLLQKEQSKAVVFTKSIPINYLKAEEMQKHIQAVMNSAGRKGTITVVEQTNNIVVTDTQEGIAQAERLVAQLDNKPAQVMIEARIVEINLNNGFDIGVQWEFADQNLSNNGNDLKFLGQNNNPAGSARISNTVNGVDVGANSPANNGTGVNLPIPDPAGAITFGFINGANQALSATLAALVTQSKAKILAAPKVVTINGQQAKIEAVQEIPFRTSVVSGNGQVSNSFENVPAGIILDVTPTINAEDRITLKIKPESSFPTQEETEAGPVIRSRTAETTVIVKDGDTLVIGGLIDDQDTEGVSKVPLLGDIPIIGIFFRNNTNRKIRNELLIFVTPRIIRD